MRLTCPNCSARYEVDDALIPAEGRDVQCSNCATTWFQAGPGTPPPEIDDDDEDAAGGTGSDAPLPRRELPRDVREILMQEAAREARLRRGDTEPEPVETQAEKSLEQAPTPPRQPRRPAASGQATQATAPTTPAASAAPIPVAATRPESRRRNLLPDIEQINSTLRATEDRLPEEADTSDVETIDRSSRRRRGVRTGFGITVVAAAVLAWVYVQGDQFSEWVPEAAPYIALYTDKVNEARFWLDDVANTLITPELTGATGGE